MSELKPDHGAVLKAFHFFKQIADLLLQLELVAGDCLRPVVFAAQSRNMHDLHIAIENWLSVANRHILNPTKLMLLHQLHQAALDRAKVLSNQWRRQARSCL